MFVHLFYLHCPMQQVLVVWAQDLTLEECAELGFSRNLLCTSCSDLEKFSLGKVRTECESCCHDVETQDQSQVRGKSLQDKVDMSALNVVKALKSFSCTLGVGIF